MVEIYEKTGNLNVGGALLVDNGATVTGAVAVTGAATVTGNPTVTGDPAVTGDSTITGDVTVTGSTELKGDTHLNQSTADAEAPPLLLTQADVDQDMIELSCTIAEGNAIEAVGAKTLTTTHFIKVTITGVGARYIPVGTIA